MIRSASKQALMVMLWLVSRWRRLRPDYHNNYPAVCSAVSNYQHNKSPYNSACYPPWFYSRSWRLSRRKRLTNLSCRLEVDKLLGFRSFLVLASNAQKRAMQHFRFRPESTFFFGEMQFVHLLATENGRWSPEGDHLPFWSAAIPKTEIHRGYREQFSIMPLTI